MVNMSCQLDLRLKVPFEALESSKEIEISFSHAPSPPEYQNWIICAAAKCVNKGVSTYP